MKTLPLITVGRFEIEVSAEHAGGHILAITVKHGDESLTGNMTNQGSHDRTEAEYENDVNLFARRLAEELAGTLRSKELAEKFARG